MPRPSAVRSARTGIPTDGGLAFICVVRRDAGTWLVLPMTAMLRRAAPFPQHRYRLALPPLHVLLVAVLVRGRLLWLAVPALAAVPALLHAGA